MGRGLGVSPRDLILSPLPSRKGVRGMVRATSETTLPRSGGTARRRHPRLLRCTRNDEIRREWQYLARPCAEGGVQRGAASLAGVWGCPQPIFVLPRRPQSGSPEGHSLFGRGLGVSCLYQHVPVQNAGVQRAPPFGRGLGVSPRDLIFSPLPSRKGVRGMVRATSETTLPEAEVPRAAATPDCFAALAMTKGDAGRLRAFATPSLPPL